MIIKTTDNKVLAADAELINRSILLKNIAKYPDGGELHMLFDSKTLAEILLFVKRDKHILDEHYNPLDLYFAEETLGVFDHLNTQELLDVCNAANYLEYPFLFELSCKLLAIRISEQPEQIKSEILGDGRLTYEDFQNIVEEYDWMHKNNE